MKISVVGTGYVGLIQSVGLAEFGFEVVGIDIDETKVKQLNKGKSPLYEEGLEELLKKHVNKNLTFTTSYEPIKDSDVVFLCVGTPQDNEGNADLRFLFSAVEKMKDYLDEKYRVIVIKSTVPVGTNRKVKEFLKGYNVDVVSNPEFLREGIAVYDFFNPERIVLGFEDLSNKKPIEIMETVYKYFKEKNVPFIITNWETSELIKYASNAFLATKISFINELAKLSDKVGADIKTISYAMGLDKRIGDKFLNAGIGYGGSCFHPDEILFVDFGDGLECMTFKELFDKLSKDNKRCVKVLSVNKNLKLDLVNLKLITKRDYSDDLIVLKTSMGREIKITKDHPVVVLSGDKIQVKLAENIKEGDEVILPTGEFGNNDVITIDVLEEIKNTPLIEKTFLNNKNMVLNEFENIRTYLSNKYIHDVKKSGTVKAKDMLPIRSILNKYNYNSNRLFTVRSKSTTIPSKIKIDGDFARLIGYYLAEGWISEDGKKNGAIRKRIGFSFGAHEKEHINDVKNILNKLGIKYIEKIRNGSHSIIISSKLLAYIFEEVLKCGNNCYNKQIPPQIFNSPSDIKWEFLKGILRGDGCIVKLNNNKNLVIEYGTVSKKLANSLLLLLQSLGIVASLKRCYNNKSTTLTYIIRINGLNQVKKIGELFGDKWSNYKKITDRYKRNIKPIGYKKFDNYVSLKVKSVEREYYDGEVYSVETDNNLLISSYGLLIHNCFPKDVKALIKQFENNNIEPILIKATDKVNEEQIKWFFEKIKGYYGNLNGKTFAVLGLAFKPNTDDLRESRAIKLIDMLLDSGAIVKGFDYVEKARENTINMYKLNKSKVFYGYNLYVLDDLYEAVKDVDGIIIATEYDYNKEDWKKIGNLVKEKVIFDGRNVLDVKKVKKLGFKYYGVGRR
ncbi:nucleotide sugar dehydrogenase [Methanotorris igneus]|uniref:Nucleotide sugar dehydrogenase n=1 Tax=Methanotorris igneus (strain DSM 5666 / JCM 11834 / Kol 5) TaxID=880724 RepID=F6BA94_METIK|nr:nucleotide sugar dehydrogenase [Methanotorris igneus]AEF95784.1 nucleotide sugar dehydrogenase [Methanotorris igneus Kol 5]